MSDFRKGLIFTAVPIVVLSAIGWFGFLVELFYWASTLALGYCLLTLILSITFYFGRGEKKLASGMFIGTCIGIGAVAANIWWYLHSIGWT